MTGKLKIEKYFNTDFEKELLKRKNSIKEKLSKLIQEDEICLKEHEEVLLKALHKMNEEYLISVNVTDKLQPNLKKAYIEIKELKSFFNRVEKKEIEFDSLTFMNNKKGITLKIENSVLLQHLFDLLKESKAIQEGSKITSKEVSSKGKKFSSLKMNEYINSLFLFVEVAEEYPTLNKKYKIIADLLNTTDIKPSSGDKNNIWTIENIKARLKASPIK